MLTECNMLSRYNTWTKAWHKNTANDSVGTTNNGIIGQDEFETHQSVGTLQDILNDNISDGTKRQTTD
jgi:hypothetical protein